MKKRLKQLGKDSVIYGIGGVSAKAIGFLLLPVYTRVFSPAEYGTIEMLSVIGSFVGVILGMGMDAAQSFYFFKEKEKGRDEQARMVTSILQWRLAWGTLIVAVSMALAPLLNATFFGAKLSWEYFALAFAGALFAQVMKQSVEVYRLLYRPWRYIGLTLGQSVGSAAVALILIIGLDQGILGFLIGSLTGSLVTGVVGWRALRRYLNWSRWHADWWPRLIRFGAPLIPAALGMYIMNTADRWFIVFYHNEDMLGTYAVGARFASLIAFAVTTFRQAWWPVAMDAMQSPEGPELFRTIARLYMGLASAGVVLVTAISPWLVRWFTAPAFHQAYPIVGVLAWQSIFFGFYLIAAAGLWKREKTQWAPFLMGVGAILNILLDILLIPRYGGLGAAAATSLSFLAWIILTLRLSERLWHVGHHVWILGAQVLMGFTATGGILYLYVQGGGNWQAGILALSVILVLIATSARASHHADIFGRLKFSLARLFGNQP